MAYGTIYRLQYDNQEDGSPLLVTVHIADTSTSGALTTTFFELQPATSNPARISVIDNDNDKYKSIRAKQLDIYFTSQSYNARTFSDGPDKKWYVEKFTDAGEILFKGFLQMDGHQQVHLEPIANQVTHLVAIDGLGTLKEQQLLKADSKPITVNDVSHTRGMFKLAEIVALCLKGTGLDLEIIINDTWFEEDNTTFTGQWNLTYVWSKSFEGSEVGKTVSRYEALEILLGWRLELFQYHGAWYITSVDERTGSTVYRFRYDSSGAFLGLMTNTTFPQTIGLSEPIKLTGADTQITFTRPVKEVELTARYELPLEIVDNIAFERGDIYTPLTFPADFVDSNGNTVSSILYHVDDWTVYGGNFNTQTAPSASNVAYILRRFILGAETERFLQLKSVNTTATYIRTNPIMVQQYDKFTCGLDFRVGPRGIVLGVLFYVQFILAGNNGTNYILQPNPRFIVLGSGTSVVWTVYNPSLTQGVPYKYDENNTSNDWHSYTLPGDAPQFPVDGDLYIVIPFMNTIPDLSIQNLQFDYQPFINGNYASYKGHSHKITQAGNYVNTIREEVTLFDSPKRLFKYTLYKIPGTRPELTESWFAGGDLHNQGIDPPIPSIYLHKFGFLQAFAIWNQYNRRMVELSGSLYGLRLSAANVPDMVHNYTETSGAEETDNKLFMLTGMDQDSHTGEWTGTFSEVFDTLIGKEYSDTYEFKYIQER